MKTDHQAIEDNTIDVSDVLRKLLWLRTPDLAIAFHQRPLALIASHSSLLVELFVF